MKSIFLTSMFIFLLGNVANAELCESQLDSQNDGIYELLVSCDEMCAYRSGSGEVLVSHDEFAGYDFKVMKFSSKKVVLEYSKFTVFDNVSRIAEIDVSTREPRRKLIGLVTF